MLIKYIMLSFIGLSGGVVVAGGIFSFITMVGVIQRLASRTKTAKHISLYENLVIAGGCIGNIMVVFQLSIPVGVIGIILFGLFSGIYVGCIAMALAETLKLFPVFVERIKLTQGIPYIVLAIAFGKGIGAFYQLYYVYLIRK